MPLRRRIEPFALLNIRPIDACRGIADEHLTGACHRLRHFARHEHLRPARAVELDGNASHCVCRDFATCPNIHSLAETNYPTGFDRRTWLLGCLSALLLLLTWRRPQAWLASYDFRWATARANVGRFLGWALLAFLVAKGAHTFWTTLVEGIRSGAGEPFLWSEGVSMWPAQVFRLISIVLSIVFLVHVARSMRETMRDIESSIGIAPDPLFTETARGADLWLRGPLRPFEGEGMEGTRYDAGEQPTEMVRIEALWAGFRNRLRLAGAWRWIALVTIVLCLMSWLAESGPWRPFLPHRGNLVQYTDRFLEFWHIALGALLLVTVVYITRVTRAFIVRLAEKPSDWPSKVLEDAAHAEGMPPEMLASWVDFRLLVKLSERVSTLIYYPFVILALGIVSRNSFFDATEWPLALQIVIGLSLLYALHSAYAMRRAAEFARDEAVRHYAGRVMRLNGGKSNLPERLRANFEPAALAKQCSDLIARIRSEEGGAFKPFSQQPIVKAILIPLGGFGGVSLAEYFALASL